MYVDVRLFCRWMGESEPTNPGHCIDFLNRNTNQVRPSMPWLSPHTSPSDRYVAWYQGHCSITYLLDGTLLCTVATTGYLEEATRFVWLKRKVG